MIKRKGDTVLEAWKNENGKEALFVEGPRRVGKTTSIEEFAKTHYRSYVAIDFVKHPEYRDIFSGSLDPKDLFPMITARFPTPLYARDSLIFFDEVEACPSARTAIKYLVADGRYDYIESGSLRTIRDPKKKKEDGSHRFNPSEERTVNMRSLDFEEYLWNRTSLETIAYLRDCFEKGETVKPFINDSMMKFLREYMIVGGMPKAVSAFLATQNLNAVGAIQDRILKLYRDDIADYAETNAALTAKAFEEIPSQLGKANRRFYFASSKPYLRFRDFDQPIQWLSDAEIADLCFSVEEPIAWSWIFCLAETAKSPLWRSNQETPGKPYSLKRPKSFGRIGLGSVSFFLLR
jgi:predicted AAA+ superfamily ATPase